MRHLRVRFLLSLAHHVASGSCWEVKVRPCGGRAVEASNSDVLRVSKQHQTRSIAQHSPKHPSSATRFTRGSTRSNVGRVRRPNLSRGLLVGYDVIRSLRLRESAMLEFVQRDARIGSGAEWRGQEEAKTRLFDYRSFIIHCHDS